MNERVLTITANIGLSTLQATELLQQHGLPLIKRTLMVTAKHAVA